MHELWDARSGRIKTWQWIVFCVFWVGCTPSSYEEIRWEARQELKKLTQCLQQIETPEDVSRQAAFLQKRYLRIADLVIQARFLEGEKDPQELEESEELFTELARLYEIPTMKERLEACQMQALERLEGRSGLFSSPRGARSP